MPEIKSIHDLHVLRLDDLDTYNSYIRHSSCPANCWWEQFPYYWGYSLTKKRQAMWAIVDDLFVPFLFSGKYLSLLTMPFGEGTLETYMTVLNKCFNLCSRQNSGNQLLTHLRWVTEDQIEFLQKSTDFDNLFDAEKLTIGPEYHYDIHALLKLDGKEFAGVRYKRNKFTKKYPEIVIREYRSSDYPHVIELNDKWLAGAQKRYHNIFDEAYYPAFFKNQKEFDHIILVAERANSIVGMIAGAVTPNGQSYCFLRKAIREYIGLSEVLLLRLIQTIHKQDSRVQLLNDGGTGLKPGMITFKNQFRPKMLVNRYCLRMNSLKILQQLSYRGPSIAGFSTSARLVLESTRADMFLEIPHDTRQRLNMLIIKALGSDAEGLQLNLKKCPAQIIAQVAVIIQQAYRHPVRHYGARKLASDKVEISFELLRPALLAPLVECIQALWRSGFLNFDENIFVDQYQSNRKTLGIRLNEYIIWDRIKTAQRLGVDARPDMGLRAWLGRGAASRLISLGYTQNTPWLGKKIAGDKSLSFTYMLKKGLPLPKQQVARSEKAAIKASRDIGYPVVVKPRHGNKGEGVLVNLATAEAVAHAFSEARKIAPSVVVESFVEGKDYRLLVINGRFIAAVKRIPAHVVGDGQHTVNELMEITNREERRDGLFLYPLKNNSETRRLLKEQRLTCEDVPVKGILVWLRGAANVSLGGTIEDVTDLVHADNRAAAVSAAATCLLDVAGIDFKSTDISRSWRDEYGKIIEINAGPGIELHMEPTIGTPREVTHHMIRSHFPSHRKDQYPLFMIAGRYGKESVARHCAKIWSMIGISPGLMLKDQIETSTDTIQTHNSLYEKMSILDRQTGYDAAAVILPMTSLMREGVCTNRYTCAVLTDDLINKKIAERYHDSEILFRVFKLLADTATHGVVIDGRNNNLYKAVKHLSPESIVKVWPEPYTSIPSSIKKHCERGGRALCLSINNQDSDHSLIWYENNSSHIIPIPELEGSRLKSVMMAIAALLISSATVEKLQPILFEYKNTTTRSSLNSLVTDRCTKRGVRVACADPHDIDAMNTFCTRHLGTKGSLYLVASGKPGMVAEWEHWKQNLSAKQVYYMLETEPGNTQAFTPTRLFNTIEEACKQALHFARNNDTVLLLAQGHAVRKHFFTEWMKQPVISQCIDKPSLWEADTLAELFQGTWINGRSNGWGADRIGWGKSMIGSNMITILPGNYPEKSENIAPMEAAVEEVVHAGACAAISAIISNKLPRWKAVMQVDDPLGGLLRLADYARQRLQGIVITLSTSNNNMQLLLEMMKNYLSNQSNQDVFISDTYSDELLDNVTAVGLALANTPPDFFLNIFPWAATDPFTGRMLRPDIMVFDATGKDCHKPQIMVADADEKTTIFAVTTPEQEKHWDIITRESSAKIHLFISSAPDDNPDPVWEKISTAILENTAARFSQLSKTDDTHSTNR